MPQYTKKKLHLPLWCSSMLVSVKIRFKADDVWILLSICYFQLFFFDII